MSAGLIIAFVVNWGLPLSSAFVEKNFRCSILCHLYFLFRESVGFLD